MAARRNKSVKSIFLIAMIMLFSFLPQSAANSEGEQSNQQSNPGLINGRENTYLSYINKYKAVPFAKDEIILGGKDAVISPGNADTRPELDGVENAVVFNEGGWMEWQFEAPETALYGLNLDYYPMPGKNADIELSLSLDGKSPFYEADHFAFKRVWQDSEEIKRDFRGNDLTPRQKEVQQWVNMQFEDHESFHSGAYYLYLEAGRHSIKLSSVREPVAIGHLKLTGENKVLPYSEEYRTYSEKGYRSVENILEKQQAEITYQKSDPMITPVCDRSSPVTEPSDPSKIRLNTIWWSDPGTWVSYRIEVPQDGLYKLAVKYRQNFQIGMTTLRNIYIDGKIPFQEMENVAFPYDVSWRMKTISDSSGKPCLVYLSKGTHEIKFEATLGKWSEVMEVVDEVNYELNNLYRKIIMVTGTTPDLYRDYNLDKEIPGMTDTMKNASAVLETMADRFDKLNGKKASQSEILRRNAEQLRSFIENPETIPARLSKYRDNISALSSWLLRSKWQPLEVDYFILASRDKTLPNPDPTFLQNMVYGVQTFIASFFEDYNSISEKYDSGKSITVWINNGRDQAQIIKEMIDDRFTPETGIKVNLSLVQSGFIEATLAGSGPDVALGVARGQPVNLACRGALADLSGYDNFKSVAERFSSTAMIPYEYQGGCYAIPDTQTFFMMFYRKDIFKELSIDPPQTWDELYKLIPVLQRNNMSIGLPYMGVTAAGSIDAGLGAKDMFPTLLLQNGGTFYKDDRSATALDSPQAYHAFKMWSEFYTKYGFPVTYDFNSRFRTGEMPLEISIYTLYNMFSAAAPEIRDMWDMVPIPGVKNPDGSINRSAGASGTADIIFKKAQNKEACWKFLDWWTSSETQYTFGVSLENIMGPGARYNTANIDAFDRLPWSKEEVGKIEEQRKYIQEVPEIPGSYFTARCLDNAFRAVIMSGKNAREQFEQENQNINDELKRKRIELGTK